MNGIEVGKTVRITLKSLVSDKQITGSVKEVDSMFFPHGKGVSIPYVKISNFEGKERFTIVPLDNIAFIEDL